MKGFILSEKQIGEFAGYLKSEEKSKNTIEKYIRDVRALAAYINGQAITKERVIAYKNKLICENYAVRSINSMLASLNSLFAFLGREDVKVKSIRLQQQIYCPEEKELTKEEYLRLLQTARQKGNERLDLLIQTICGTGIRVSELQYITVELVKKGEVAEQGLLGWIYGSWHEVGRNGVLDTLKTNIPDAEVVAFVLENVHGEMYQGIYAPTAILNMVPAWSECPEGVVQYLDWMCIPENAQVLMYGFNYEVIDGVPQNSLENKMYANVSDYALVYNGNPDFDTNVAATIATLSDMCKEVRGTTLKTAIIGGVSPYQFGNIESETKYSANLSSTMAELRVNCVMAPEGTFDQVYDQWHDEYMSIGGEEVEADKRAFYQANN